MADVLLVDDDGSVLLTLAIALRRQGHTVTVAGDAQQALAHLKRHHFGFIVSDVRMPGMSGIELALRVRRMNRAPRIILTSAYSNIEVRDGVAELFLQKPLDVSTLHSVLCSGNNGTEDGHGGHDATEHHPHQPNSEANATSHHAANAAHTNAGHLNWQYAG